MGVYINDAGTLRTINRAFINDAGTLREAKRFSINDAGTLRHIFMIQVQLNTSYDVQDVAVGGSNSSAGWQLHSDGTIDEAHNHGASPVYSFDDGTWLVTGVNSDYECRATLNSGSLDVGTTGSWMALSTTRNWSVTVSGPSSVQDADLTIEIRRVSDSLVLDSTHLTLHAETTT